MNIERLCQYNFSRMKLNSKNAKISHKTVLMMPIGGWLTSGLRLRKNIVAPPIEKFPNYSVYASIQFIELWKHRPYTTTIIPTMNRILWNKKSLQKDLRYSRDAPFYIHEATIALEKTIDFPWHCLISSRNPKINIANSELKSKESGVITSLPSNK